MNTSNDMALKSYCVYAPRVRNKYSVMLDLLVRYDIPLEEINDLSLMVDVVSYRTIQTFLEDPNIRFRTLEKKFMAIIADQSRGQSLDMKKVAHAWIMISQIIRRLEEIMLNADEYYTNIPFIHSMRGETYNLSIDLYTVRGHDRNGNRLISILPKPSIHPGLSVLSNLDNVLALGFLAEADLRPTSVIEIGYNSSLIEKGYSEVEYPVDRDTHLTALESFTHSMNDPTLKLIQCRSCLARRVCFPDALHRIRQ